MGGFGPSCGRGDGGDGSSGSSSRLLRPPKLQWPLAFTSEPERDLVVGSLVVEAIGGEVVVARWCWRMTVVAQSLRAATAYNRWPSLPFSSASHPDATISSASC